MDRSVSEYMRGRTGFLSKRKRRIRARAGRSWTGQSVSICEEGQVSYPRGRGGEERGQEAHGQVSL